MHLQKQLFPKVAFAFALAVAMLQPQHAQAADSDAKAILKSMSDYLAAQRTILVTFDSSLEAITPRLFKVQFNSTGTLLLKRPDELRATRVGGFANVEMFYNGKTLTVYGKNLDGYTQLDAPGFVDKLIDVLRSRGWTLPGADLLTSNVFDTMSEGVIEAMDIGPGVISGIKCEHLAFRAQDVDWQLWVQSGDKPIPRKLVITSKAVGGAPQYTLVIRDWKTDVPAEASDFEFTPPPDAAKLDLSALKTLDELPPPSTAKGQ